jgi:hypothetical protein
MRTAWLKKTLGVGSLMVCALACAAKEDDNGISTDPVQAGMTGGGGVPAGAGGVPDAGAIMTNSDPSSLVDAGGGVTYLDAGFNGDKCVSTKAVAPPASSPKIDIVWVVDSSQSMFGEQDLIKQNLKQFADGITGANIDVSISMVSKYPTLIPGDIQVPGLCPDNPPDPLAGTPLASDPRYHFVHTEVGSNDTLNIAMSRYPMYSQFLRPGSVVHFIVVTDDEAQYKGAPTAQARAMQFQADMMAQLGRPFFYHTISSPPGMRCNSPNCMPDLGQGICALIDLGCQAAAGGDTHYALAMLTKGLSASICESDWTKIFKTFQDTIVKSAPLPCDYSIPPPPKGDTLNPNKVNVAYTPAGSMAEETFGKVAGQDACGMNTGWFYDNASAPTKVLLCPATCSKVASGGTMNIVYGCNTIELQ